MTAAALTISSCTYQNKDIQDSNSIISKQEHFTIPSGLMTPETLWAMGRIGDYQVSSDGKKIVYTVAYYSVEQDKSHRVIYVINTDGTGNTLLTNTAHSESSPCWIKNDTKIAFLSNVSGKTQIWEMNPDGSERKQLSDLDKDIEGFSLSPDGKKVLFVAQVQSKKQNEKLYKDLPKASGIIVTDLMYKHWDEWVETIPHPYIADFNGSSVTNPIDLLEGEPYESPMKPFGGMEQLAWSPDGKQIAYTCRKKEGLAYSISTDSDIYLYDIASHTTRNLCKPEGYKSPNVKATVSLQKQSVNTAGSQDLNVGYDTNPKFSPNGKYIAWQSMERDGYESDRNRLCVMNLTTGEKQYVTETFESGVEDFCWNNDSESFYFLGVWHGAMMIYTVNMKGQITPLTDGQYDYTALNLSGNQLIVKRQSMSMADEIYNLNLTDNTITAITNENKFIYDQLTMGEVKARWTKTTDNKDMHSWVIYPPHFDPNKKYPTLLFCEGGPQSPVSQFWSYRWNMQIMAAHGYIIIAPNRRGLPGFGMEWLEQISGDYAGQCMKDYLSAIDDIAKEPYVDINRLGCVGASFGGYSVYWLAGNHNKRFKTFISHDGIFNMEQQYLETEEMWFANWDMGGAYWEYNNATAQRTFANSPHKFVDKWDAPILCIHGEKDYRILASQGMSAFNAAVLRGIPAELLLYPDENHWVLKPQNGVLWQRTFFDWLDKWLK